jgi:Fe-S-cluster containining protein
MTANSSAPSCLRCGHCCRTSFLLYVGDEDERRWEAEGRTDVLQRLDWERWHVTWDDDGAYHIDTGERLRRCFFLEASSQDQALCRIHDTKPMICRDYPPGSSDLCVLYKPPRT